MLAFVVGLTLGVVFALLGAGGGILAVPTLMVLFSESMTVATGAGLAVVFAAAVAGAIAHGRAGRVDWRVAGLFGLPSIAGAVAGAKLHALVPERVTMGLFAFVLLLAVGSMLRGRREGGGAPGSTLLLLGVGVATGVLTGFLGVGGGFLIVPALTVFAQVPLHRAIGTSMAIIAASSLSGAITHLIAGHVPLALVAPMAAGAVIGALVGAPLSARLPERPLKLGFVGLAVVVSTGMALAAAGLL